MAAGKRGRRSPHARSLQVALMVDIIREDEGEALDYPAMPDGLSDAALSIEPAAVWQRIESWITHRYGERTVEWITRGPGVFVPRLKPAELVTVERWSGEDWASEEPARAPEGLMLGDHAYRLTYTVGTDDTPPASVMLAYARLAEYWAESDAASAGLTSVTDGDYSFTRAATAAARALQNSGAADLLRAYRR